MSDETTTASDVRFPVGTHVRVRQQRFSGSYHAFEDGAVGVVEEVLDHDPVGSHTEPHFYRVVVAEHELSTVTSEGYGTARGQWVRESELEPDTKFQVGDRVLIHAEPSYHSFSEGAVGEVIEVPVDRGTLTQIYRVVVENTSLHTSDLSTFAPRPGQWVHEHSLELAPAGEPVREFHRGDRVYVEHFASTIAKSEHTDRTDGRGYVHSGFFGREGIIYSNGANSSGCYTVECTETGSAMFGHRNTIHGDYLALVTPERTSPRDLVPDERVIVDSWASTRPKPNTAREGFVNPDFFGEEVKVVSGPDHSGCYQVERDTGSRNTIHRDYLTPMIERIEELLEPAAAQPAPAPAPRPLDQAAVDEAVQQFKDMVAEVAMRRARHGGINIEVVKEALREWGITPEEPSRRFTGTITLTVPFDVTIDDSEWTGDEEDAERYIRNAVRRYQDLDLFDSDVENNNTSSLYLEDIEINNVERVDEE